MCECALVVLCLLSPQFPLGESVYFNLIEINPYRQIKIKSFFQGWKKDFVMTFHFLFQIE